MGYARDVELDLSPGKPTDNTVIESPNGNFERSACRHTGSSALPMPGEKMRALA